MNAIALSVTMLCSATAIAFAQGPGQPSTDSFKASALYTACTHSGNGAPNADDKFNEETCDRYLLGLTDALFIMQVVSRKSLQTCMPEQSSITPADARKIFVSWFKAHPDEAVHSAGIVAVHSILNAYECHNAN